MITNITWDTLHKRILAGEPLRFVPPELSGKKNDGERNLFLGRHEVDGLAETSIAQWKSQGLLEFFEDATTGVCYVNLATHLTERGEV